jgi:hypothetical protein
MCNRWEMPWTVNKLHFCYMSMVEAKFRVSKYLNVNNFEIKLLKISEVRKILQNLPQDNSGMWPNWIQPTKYMQICICCISAIQSQGLHQNNSHLCYDTYVPSTLCCSSIHVYHIHWHNIQESQA